MGDDFGRAATGINGGTNIVSNILNVFINDNDGRRLLYDSNVYE